MENQKNQESMIAYCGLDCAQCEARIATVNDDDALRAKVAQKWSAMNGVEITPAMINCMGCKADGVKTVFCDSMCEIRKCAIAKQCATCGKCSEMGDCPKLAMITSHNDEALRNLNS